MPSNLPPGYNGDSYEKLAYEMAWDNTVTLGVLAGAYGRRGQLDRGNYLTHSVEIRAENGHRVILHALCGKVRPDSICPDGGLTPEDGEPTCPRCRKLDPRFPL